MIILLIEDNQGDLELMRDALRESTPAINLMMAHDGEEALRMLAPKDVEGQPVLPDIIILDLNLPRKDGREVLAEIKANPALRRIPVVVFTTSSSEEDIDTAYSLGANCYITKPIGLQGFLLAMRAIESFWCGVAQLPPVIRS